MFTPGETVTHLFALPFLKSEIDKIILTFKQNDEVILEKCLTNGDNDTYIAEEPYPKHPDGRYEIESTDFSSVEYKMPQEESLLFANGGTHSNCSDYSMQLNVYLTGDTRIASMPMYGKNGKQYYPDIIS